MKTIIFKTAALSLLILISASCTTTIMGTKSTPPGQQKKETGSKSAKQFAPGQQKKATGSKSATQAAPGQQKKKP